MPIIIKRQENETTGSMLRRFTRTVQQSGTLVKARRVQFYNPPKSKREKRLSALYRQRVRKERERLQKLGVIDEEEIKAAIQKLKQRWRREH
ncbi:MAG: 30S ribosomal protein S21 [bacterium]|nr:30S ribosomal protein S21 [bacterium]MDZ4295845.1 30S ribosomal protein S21 [Patescibacteria group bacterium]MDZ4295868.1 30S ribosomal protein S21 [Patescibacteria group bacterium]